MPFYSTSDEFYATMQTFFDRMRDQQPNPVDTLVNNKISVRLKISQPSAEIAINARRNPVDVSFGDQIKWKPELDIQLSADTLHSILLDELSLSKALSDRKLKVSGPVWKTLTLADIFHQGKAIYPKILDERNLSQ
jgi:hypothetical protein